MRNLRNKYFEQLNDSTSDAINPSSYCSKATRDAFPKRVSFHGRLSSGFPIVPFDGEQPCRCLSATSAFTADACTLVPLHLPFRALSPLIARFVRNLSEAVDGHLISGADDETPSSRAAGPRGLPLIFIDPVLLDANAAFGYRIPFSPISTDPVSRQRLDVPGTRLSRNAAHFVPALMWLTRDIAPRGSC